MFPLFSPYQRNRDIISYNILLEELMVCMVILKLCITLERKGQLLFSVFWHIYKREDNRIFFQRNHIGQSFINSGESRTKSATISE